MKSHFTCSLQTHGFTGEKLEFSATFSLQTYLHTWSSLHYFELHSIFSWQQF